MDRALSDGAPLREVRSRRAVALQAIKGDWNGSGNAQQLLFQVPAAKWAAGIFRGPDEGVREEIPDHIAVYGPDNHLRLTGLHETQAIDKFSYGLSDRGASVPSACQLHQARLQGLP